MVFIRANWLILCISIFLIGSGAVDEDNGQLSSELHASISEQRTTARESARQDALTNEIGKQSDETESIAETTEKPLLPDEIPEVSRPMTENELKEIEDFINGREAGSYKNYGYLQSGYSSPEYADLSLIFYTGAGIPSESQMTEAEIAAYEEAIGPIELDVVRLTTAEIDKFLQETAGIELKDHQSPYPGYYLPEFDAYYHQIGDTNFIEYVCHDGVVENGQYKVRSSCSAYECMTTLRKAGSSYQFIANQFIVSEGVVKDTEELNDLVRLYIDDSRQIYTNEPDFNTAIFETDKRYFTKEELLNVNPYLLEIARNELYARHGYIFQSSRLKVFFSQYSWYQEEYPADAFSDSVLNQYEKANRDLILSLESWNK